MIKLKGARRDASFERFVASSTDGLLRTAYLLAWDLSEAEDLVQETLLRVAKRWPRVRSMEHPLAYARQVLTNLALDGAQRRSRRRAELNGSLPEPGPAPGDEAGFVDTRSELITALGTLPARQRTVLVLRYFIDLPESEVAAILGCSLGTVKSTASRGLARLEQQLSESRMATSDNRSRR